MNNTVLEIIDVISKTKEIYIASHVNPDGDNLGSILGITHALKKLGKNVHIIKTDEIPSDYLFLPGIDLIKQYDSNGLLDLLIVLDCGDADRLGEFKKLISKATKTINIDHHVSNTCFGDYNLVDDKAAATAEIVYKLVTSMGIELDENIATCLYTGISTDTGSFMYDSVSDKTHEIVAELIRAGIDKTSITINLYQNRSMPRTKLFIDSFSTLNTFDSDRIATVKVTQNMLEKANAKMEDTEGIISFIRDIDSVEVAVLLKEFKKNEIKIGLRSKKFIDVAEICAAFNGGGHIRAAGCTINDSIENAEKLITDKIMKAFR